MPTKNAKAISFLNSLISSGNIDTGSWSFSSADGNKLLGSDGDDWTQYGKVHLAIYNEYDPDTKQHYGYPVAKFVGNSIKIFRRGVIAAKSAASGGRGAEKSTEIANAANALLKKINKKLGLEEDNESEDACGTKKKKKVDQHRIDYLSSDSTLFMTQKFDKTEEGYLRGRSIITNVGVFPYRMADGSIFHELRPPEEVFDTASIESFKMIPVTNEHPSEKVTQENIKEYQVGFTGDNVYRDEYHISSPITITDQETITDIQTGAKRALSCGYTCDVEETEGVWMGVHYDGIQRNIRGNHLAVVNQGRAGDAAIIKMDSMDNIGVHNIDKNFYKGEESMALKKIKIDGVEYEAEADVIKAYTASKEKADSLEKEIAETKKDVAKLEGERDQYKDEAEKLQKEKKENKNDEEFKKAVEEATKKRLVVIDAARRADIEIKEDSTEAEIKKDIIMKLFPNAKEKMEKADESYIEARFDIALEHLDNVEEDSNTDEEALKGDSISKGTKKYTADDAYNKSVKRMMSNWERKDQEDK